MGISVSSWSTYPTTFLNSLSETSRPLTRVVPVTVPLLSFLARISKKVDFPAPDAPMMAMTWPGLTRPDIPSRILRLLSV